MMPCKLTTSFLSLVFSGLASAQVELDVGAHHKLIQGRHGAFLINRRDSWIGRSLELYGEWSEAELSLISKFIKEGDLVIDVGANIGALTIPMAKAVGPKGKIIAFEPQRIVSQILNANLALNEITNTAVYNAAVGNSPSRLQVPDLIYSKEGNFGAISLLFDWASKGANVEPVTQVILDNVLTNQCPSFLKIDVEGMELMVLNGALKVLKACNPVIHIENNCKKDSKELILFLTNQGYICHWDVNPYFSQDNFKNNKVNIFSEEVHSVNMLCVSEHDSASMEKAQTLPAFTRIKAESGLFFLHEYNLAYVGKESDVLTQLGTLEACER